MLSLDQIDFRKNRPGRNSSEEQFLEDQVFQQLRTNGFPYPAYAKENLEQEYLKLVATPSCIDIDTGVIRQSMVGLGIINSYHPEMLGVRCRGFMTPLEVFADDALLREAIRKRIRYGDNLKPWGIRKSIYALRRTQRVSNFRPTVAKSIIEYVGAKTVMDPCAGWGGRLFGAMAAKVRYVGVDPHQEAQNRNREFFRDLAAKVNTTFQVSLLDGCAEDLMPSLGVTPDLVLTSPPYFNVEKYSEDAGQSYLRYPTQEQWEAGFLWPLIWHAHRLLSDRGWLVLNVNPNMLTTVVQLASRVFIGHFVWLMLRKQHQYNKASSGLYRSEPVVFFRKGVNLTPPLKQPTVLDFFG